MGLNVQTFKTRAITAVIFAAVMLAGLFLNAWTFITLFLIVLAGGLYEFYKLLRKIYPAHYVRYLPLGLVYVAMPIVMLIDLGISLPDENYSFSAIAYDPLFPCAVIFCIWINDTMAYIVGSLIGKTPFSRISPKKTWEGTGGGALLCVAVAALLSQLFDVSLRIPLIHWVMIAAICAVFGTIGDLLESKIKRMAGVKDSGSFMPGHGGFLDRFDSLLIATPFVWLYLRFFL